MASLHLTLNQLLDNRFSEAHIKKVCLPQKIGSQEIIRLVLRVFGDNRSNILFLCSQMQNQLLREQFQARILRHLAYVEGLTHGQSLVKIIKNESVNTWMRTLSSFDFGSPTAMQRLDYEMQETHTFVCDPREVLFFWKNKKYCEKAKQLYHEHIERRKQLYALTKQQVPALSDEMRWQMSSLLYKDAAFYVKDTPYRWTTALQDWSILDPKNKTIAQAITTILMSSQPPLPESSIAKITSHTEVLSFQEYISLMTICSIECVPLHPSIWIKKFAASERLRSDFSFYSQHKKILILNPPRQEDYNLQEYQGYQDYQDLLSLRLYFCMGIETGLFQSPSEGKMQEKQGEKRSPKLSEIALSSYLFQTIFQRDAGLDHCIKPYFPPELVPPKPLAQFTFILKKIISLKKRVDIPLDYEFFFLVKMYKEEARFSKAIECIECLTSLLSAIELCEVLLSLTRLNNPTEMVELLKVLSASPFIRLCKNEIESLIAQAQLYSPTLIQSLFAQLIQILDPKSFVHLAGKAFTLLENPTYHPNASEDTSKGMHFLTQFGYAKRRKIDEALFFRVYRLFLEGHLHPKHLDYVYKYQETSKISLTTNVQLQILSLELPKNLPDSASTEELFSFCIAYLDSLSFLKLHEVEKVSLALHWISHPPSQQLGTRLNALRELFIELIKYLGYMPQKKDIYLLLKIVPECTTNVTALKRLFSLREEIMRNGKACDLATESVDAWENALMESSARMEDTLFPLHVEEDRLAKFTTDLGNHCRLATFLTPQLFTDCFYIGSISSSGIVFTKPLYDHGGQIKELLPHTFMTVNWELSSAKSSLTLSLFFFHTHSKIGQWLFFPLPISLKAQSSVQSVFFHYLRKLASLLLAENETENPAIKTYYNALQEMGGLEIALPFLTDLKIKVRNAWWDLLSLRPPEQTESSTLSPESWAAQGKMRVLEEFNERERKDQKQHTHTSKPLAKKAPLLTLLPKELKRAAHPFYTASEISEQVVIQAQKAIPDMGKKHFLTKAYLSGLKGAKVDLFISTSPPPGDVYKVSLYLRIENPTKQEPISKVSLSPIYYPRSFIEDKEMLHTLLSSHLLGLKTYYYRNTVR